MITSKRRAELRAQANGLDAVLMVGKGGVTESVIAEAESVLEAHELVKGRVLETALMTAREASDAICAATGAEGIQTVGSKFVIYRLSKKLEAERRAKAAAQKKKPNKATSNPVRAGVQARRRKAQEERERRNEYFRQEAINAAIERRKQGK